MDFQEQESEWLSDHSDVSSFKQKPPHVVAKRNARERRRVQAVNQAFVKLRSVVPIQNTRCVNLCFNFKFELKLRL